MRPAQPAALHQRFTPAPLALAAAMAIALAAGHAPLVHAQSGTTAAAATPIAINIPAQPLGQALNELARQANLQMTFPAGLVAGKMAPAVTGKMLVVQALGQVLAGSGLSANLVNNSTVVVQEQVTTSSEVTLPAVLVQARAYKETAFSPFVGYNAKRSSTGSKTDTETKNIPQSIVVVTSDLLRDRGVIKLSEAVDTVSGIVREGSYGGNTASADFTARGFTATKLRDGMLLNIQGFGDALDIASVERVEVLKGPASVLYGAGQPGGTVNIVSKRPYDTLGGQVEGSVDSFGTHRVRIDLNTPVTQDKRLLFRLNAAYENGSTYRDFVDRKTTVFAPTLQWTPIEGTRIMYQYENIDTRGLFDRGFDAANNYTTVDYQSLPVRRFVGDPSVGPSFTKTRQNIFTLNQRLSPDWDMKFAFSNQEFGYRNQPEIGIAGYDANTGLFDRYYIDYPNQGERTRNVSMEITGKLQTAGIQHQLVFGIDTLKNQATYIAVEGQPAPSPIDLVNPVYGGYDNFTTSFYYSGKQGNSGRSVYAQDQITLSPQWKALIGLRHDQAKRFTGAFPGQPDDTGVVSTSRFSRISPRAGMVYQPNTSDSFYSSYSTSFDPTLFITLRDPSGFKPEVGKQFEAGWKRDWIDGRMSSTLSVYEIRKSNYAVTDPTNLPTEFFQAQVGEFRSRGVEFDLAGSPWAGLQLTAGMGYSEVQVSKSADPNVPVGARIENYPRLTVSATARQSLGSGWSVGAGIFHASSAPTTIPNDGINIPAYTRFDLSLAKDWNDWRIALSVKNATNVKYYTGAYRIFPQAPRHALLTASYYF